MEQQDAARGADSSQRASRRWLVPLATLAIVITWFAAVATSLYLARGELLAAERRLDEGRASLSQADLDGAREAFSKASRHGATAHRRLRAPHVRTVGAVPVIGDNVRTVDAIAHSIADVSAAVHDLAERIGDMPGGLDALKPTAGALPVEALSQIAPATSAVADSLSAAVGRVLDAPTRYTVPLISRERTRFLDLALPATESAQVAASLTEHLPAFLGADGPRRYVLGVSNPAELRGTGGYLGSYTVLEADGGAIEVGSFLPTTDLENRSTSDVPAPNASYARRYDQFGGAGFWQNINMTPDFPSAAAAIVTLWEEVHGEAVDGVISVDPFAFEALLEVGGAVTVEGRQVDAQNVVDYVTNESYAEIDDDDERKEVIGDVAAAALEEFLTSADLDALSDALEPLSRAAEGGHLLLYSVEPAIQRSFQVAGLDGGFPESSGDVLGVFVNDGAAAKLDYYAQRSVEYEVELLRHGRISARLSVSLRNDAPTEGMPSHVIGPNAPGLSAGELRSLVSTYCSPTCRLSERPRDRVAGVSREQRFVVTDTWVLVPSGTSERLEYAWTVEDAWAERDGTVEYRLWFDDQVTVRPNHLKVTVRVPDGFAPVELPPGAEHVESSIVWERTDDRGDARLNFRFQPATGPK